MTFRKIKRAISILAANFIILLIIGESSIRLFFPDRGPLTYSQTIALANSGYYEKSETNGFTLKRNYKGLHSNQDRNLKGEPALISISTNEFGFRTTPFIQNKNCLQKKSKKVLLLGDSYTFGVYLRDDDTYPSQLQYLLNENNFCLRVINAGYANGFETDQIYSWLFQNISKLKPDIVIYNIYASNDINNINQKYWVKRSSDKGLPIEWYRPDYSISDGHIYERGKKPPYYIYSYAILRESKLLVLLERVFRSTYTSLLAKFVGVEIGFSSKNLHHLYGERDRNPEFNSKEKIFIQLVEGMKELSKANGSKFYSVYMPANFEVYPNLIEKVLSDSIYYNKESKPSGYGKYLCEKLSKSDIKCLDITIRMLKHIAQSRDSIKKLLAKNYLYPSHGEIHMSRSGAKLTAHEVFDYYFIKNR